MGENRRERIKWWGLEGVRRGLAFARDALMALEGELFSTLYGEEDDEDDLFDLPQVLPVLTPSIPDNVALTLSMTVEGDPVLQLLPSGSQKPATNVFSIINPDKDRYIPVFMKMEIERRDTGVLVMVGEVMVSDHRISPWESWVSIDQLLLGQSLRERAGVESLSLPVRAWGTGLAAVRATVYFAEAQASAAA